MQVPCGFSLALSGCGEDRATTINLETRDFAIETSNSTPASMESVRLGLVAIDAQGNRSDAALLDDITRVEWGLRRRNPANDRCGLRRSGTSMPPKELYDYRARHARLG